MVSVIARFHCILVTLHLELRKVMRACDFYYLLFLPLGPYFDTPLTNLGKLLFQQLQNIESILSINGILTNFSVLYFSELYWRRKGMNKLVYRHRENNLIPYAPIKLFCAYPPPLRQPWGQKKNVCDKKRTKHWKKLFKWFIRAGHGRKKW